MDSGFNITQRIYFYNLNSTFQRPPVFCPLHRQLLFPSVSSALQWNELPWLILQLISLLLSPQRKEARMSEDERSMGGVAGCVCVCEGLRDADEKSEKDRATPEGWVSCDRERCPLPLLLSLPFLFSSLSKSRSSSALSTQSHCKTTYQRPPNPTTHTHTAPLPTPRLHTLSEWWFIELLIASDYLMGIVKRN